MSTVTASSQPAPVPPAGPGRRQTHWRVRFAFLSLIWGFSFLFIKVGTQSYAPFQVTLGRLVFGTAVLAAVMAVKRERLPRGVRTWAHLAVAGFFLNALPFSLFAYSELTIPSTLAGICNATSPLWGMGLSLVALSEDRPTRVRVAGLGLGFLGVLTVLGAWQGFRGLDATGTAMALLASLSYPVGWIYVRRTLAGSSESHLSLTGGQLLLATLQLAVVTPVFTDLPGRLSALPLLAIAALGALGTGLAMLVQYGLVAEVGPTTAQMVTYFVPVIATAAGVALLDEDLTWSTPVGAVIVLAGAALTQARPKRRAETGGTEGGNTAAGTAPADGTAPGTAAVDAAAAPAPVLPADDDTRPARSEPAATA
ncbi:DMT family transporter [Streptomyces sp. NPDC046831]|uniref:DMT family transporter n=1 Tax=Streptomyces sp. NPDC046831 TaxID=3154805 RepID=UPI0034066BD4